MLKVRHASLVALFWTRPKQAPVDRLSDLLVEFFKHGSAIPERGHSQRTGLDQDADPFGPPQLCCWHVRQQQNGMKTSHCYRTGGLENVALSYGLRRVSRTGQRSAAVDEKECSRDFPRAGQKAMMPGSTSLGASTGRRPRQVSRRIQLNGSGLMSQIAAWQRLCSRSVPNT